MMLTEDVWRLVTATPTVFIAIHYAWALQWDLFSDHFSLAMIVIQISILLQIETKITGTESYTVHGEGN